MPSSDAMWHLSRKKKMLEESPKLKQLEGPYYPSAAWVVGLVGLQWALWWSVHAFDMSILAIFALVYVNINTGLYALSTFIHENSHGLVLGWSNRLIVACMIECGLTSFGEQWEYTCVHYTMHHPQLNDDEKDSECPGPGHVAVPPESTIMKYLIPVIELLPLGTLVAQGQISNNSKHGSYRPKHEPYVLMAVSASCLGSLMYAGMWKSVLFAVWSATMYGSRWNIALHGQSIAEHFHHSLKPDAETAATHSTYFWYENFIGFNTGYHDEHHTFPNVPWANLPELRKRAPEEFKNVNDRTYFDLWMEWATHGFETDRFRICHK